MAAWGYFHGWKKEAIEKGLKAMGHAEKSIEKSSETGTIIKESQLLDCDESLLTKKRDCLKSIQSTKYELFNDPIHGSIELHPLLAKIVNMRAFTRLKNIRQLGGVYYVYPGANHSRYEHSIGTCYVAGEFIQMLRKKQPELRITDKEALCVEIAALCHDLGHGPFSHLFEKDVMKNKEVKKILEKDNLKFPHHEKLSVMVFKQYIYSKEKELFNRNGIDDDDEKFIEELIDHDFKELMKPERRFLYEIVANKVTGIDVDKWDYFARDCHYMGILTEFDWRRLMSVSRVINVGGVPRMCYRDKEVNNIYGMFRTRCSLHQKAYQHKAVIAAEHMIAEAIVKVRDLPLIKPWTTSNRTNPDLISLTDIVKQVACKQNQILEGYLALSDGITHQILHYANPKFKGNTALLNAQELLKDLDERKMYRKIPGQAEGISESDITQQNPDEEITSADVYIRPVEISYGSEKDKFGKKGDPVELTYFYTKNEPWTAITGTEVKKLERVRQKLELVCPMKYTMTETWIYSASSKYEQVLKACDEARQARTQEKRPTVDRDVTRAEETPMSSPNTKRTAPDAKRKLNYDDQTTQDKRQKL